MQALLSIVHVLSSSRIIFGAVPHAKSCFATFQFGYTLYRRVLGYYSGEEDAYDLRKAMPRDVLQKSVVPLDRPVYPHELEHD